MPQGAIYVGRPSRWGNPFRLDEAKIGRQPTGEPWTPEHVRYWYKLWLRDQPCLPEFLAPLRGHDLACWCPASAPCHADVLLQAANR